MSEESRAAEFRRMMTARADWICDQRYHALPGSRSARAAVYANWAPWTDPIFDWDVGACDDEPGRTMTAVGEVALKAGRQLV